MSKKIVKIGFVIYPNIKPEVISPEWNTFKIPQKGEQVYFRGELYNVRNVIYNIDECIIKIMMRKDDISYAC